MNIQEELRIAGHQGAVGYAGIDEGKMFDILIHKFGQQNIHFICSMAYNLGRVHGIREERAKRRAKQK